MFLTTKMRLKILNHNKLHISRRPGIIAWITLGLSMFVFIGVSHCLTENIFTLTISIIGGTMFGLDKLGDWEDFILDKTENRATFIRCNWCEKWCLASSNKSLTTSMKLSEICHVGVSVNLGLFVLLKSGKTLSLSTNGLDREEIQIMRQEMNQFLNQTRIEYFNKISDPDLRDRLLIPSDSED